MVKKILEEKPIPLGQVHELLQIREEEGINYVQRVTAQHAEKLSRGAAYSEEVIEMIQSEFDLSRIQAVQIVNTNPKTPIDVRAVTEDRLSDDQIKRLLEKYHEFVVKLATTTIDSQDDERKEAEELEEGFEEL
ncbi:MAG: hypothetical protein ACFFAJ_15310 [Candidatus Hodarchaeota archaeon]